MSYFIKNLNEFTNTLGHELTHAIKSHQNSFIPQDNLQNNYANIKGEILSNYLNKALNLKDENVNLNNTNLNYTKNTNTKDTLLSNLDKFNSQDMSKSDNADINLFNRDLERDMYIAGEWHKSGILDRKDVIAISGHGFVGGIYDGRNNVDYINLETINIKDFAKEIKNLDKWKNAKGNISYILLDICDSGLGPKADNKNSAAQQLANELKVPVYGTTGKFNYNKYIPFMNNPQFGSKRILYKPEIK